MNAFDEFLSDAVDDVLGCHHGTVIRWGTDGTGICDACGLKLRCLHIEVDGDTCVDCGVHR